jgi:hypothetical protein
MAKNTPPKNSGASKNAEKQPGQLKQIGRVWKMTIQKDKQALPIALAAGVGAFLVALVIAFIGGAGQPFAFWSWIVVGVFGAIVTFSVVLSRRAETVAYNQIAGQPGAVGAVLGTILKRGWSGSETPVNFNPKSQDLVYRISGRAGIVLIGEGHRSGLSRLIEEEKRKLSKATAGVPVTVLWVCGDEHSVTLAKLRGEVNKLKKTLSRAELSEVNKRLSTLKLNVAMPKGIDPLKARAQRR